jgi:4-aminobutyrate aminotransferase-like enzyme
LERGLLVAKSSGGVIRLLPPLNVDLQDFDRGLSILAEALALAAVPSR